MWVRELENMYKEIQFNRKNRISCHNVSMWKVVWNYICWVLAGKPEGWVVEDV